MDDNGLSLKELHAGHIVIVAEGWRLVAGEPCEARLQKCLFYPRSKSLHVWQAIVPRGGQTIVIEVDPWSRRANLLEVLTPRAAEKGAAHV